MKERVNISEYFKRAGNGVSPAGKVILKDIPEKFT